MVLLRLAVKVAELFPRLAPRALVVVRRVLRLRRPGAVADEVQAIRQEAVSALVQIMAIKGATRHAVSMLHDEIALYQLDSGLARMAISYVLACVKGVPGEGSDSKGFSRGFIGWLLSLLLALEARSAHDSLDSDSRTRAHMVCRWVARSITGKSQWAQDIRSKAEQVQRAYR